MSDGPAAGGAPTTRTVALVGRPNAGKSSIYNRLTGGDAKVGNFPGVTVDILSAEVRRGDVTLDLVDLPGLYALQSPGDDHETDEAVARRWLDAADPARTVVVQVIDGTQLALGLRLTREILAEAFPVLLVVSQMDLVAKEKQRIDLDALSLAVGAPVRGVSARDAGAREAIFAAIDALPAGPLRRDAPAWDPEAVAEAVIRRANDRGGPLARRTARLDRVLLHPALGLVIFLALMAGLFAAVFLVADPVTSVLDAGIRAVGARITHALGDGVFTSFLVDGVLGGAGTVLAFLPQIVVLTVAMELLDASGYLSRGVFLIDRALRVFGLGGRAFVPLLTAHACAVPAITATRILRDPRERLTTLLVLPLMACSARIPTYGLLISTFFGGRSALLRASVFVGLYVAGVLAGMLATLALRRTVTRGRALPLVIEMPSYKIPEARAVVRAGTVAAKRFLRDVGTTLLGVSVLLWALLTVPMPGADPGATRVERSVAAHVGHALEPVTQFAGFDWRMNVGLIGSFGAREVMVSTLGIIWGIEDAGDDPAPLSARMRAARGTDGKPLYGPANALALMAFFVLACQCMSTVVALRRETRGWRWPLFVLGYTYAAGGVLAVVVFQVARAFTG